MFDRLESIYSVFDDIAERRRVFKVEVIGDAYVAVVGLPSKHLLCDSLRNVSVHHKGDISQCWCVTLNFQHPVKTMGCA